jgi:hypothetical protein
MNIAALGPRLTTKKLAGVNSDLVHLSTFIFLLIFRMVSPRIAQRHCQNCRAKERITEVYYARLKAYNSLEKRAIPTLFITKMSAKDGPRG